MNDFFAVLQEYNFWDNKTIHSGFIRDTYLKKILLYTNNGLIKVLCGQRRSGKSYIMRQIIANLIKNGVPAKNIFYLNKEIYAFDKIKTANQVFELLNIYREKLNPISKIYVFIDEIQEIDEWERLINSLSQDYINEFEVFISGSNSQLLSGELATILSGRYIQFEITPFSFYEFTAYYKLTKNRDSFITYLKKGGLPELLNFTNTETARHYVSSLKDTIVLRDIVQRYKIKDTYLLESLFRFLIDNIGNLCSVNSIVNYLKAQKINTNYDTIAGYINYLKQTYIIHEVERYDIKGKNVLSGVKKYYLNDLAFKNYLSSGFDIGMSQHLENAIYMYFRSEGYTIHVGTIKNLEIDFVLQKENDIKYIQVTRQLTSNEIIEREFGNMEKILNNYEKMVVSMDEFSIGTRKGIKHYCAWELL